jgi:hypothetical protein
MLVGYKVKGRSILKNRNKEYKEPYYSYVTGYCACFKSNSICLEEVKKKGKVVRS